MAYRLRLVRTPRVSASHSINQMDQLGHNERYSSTSYCSTTVPVVFPPFADVSLVVRSAPAFPAGAGMPSPLLADESFALSPPSDNVSFSTLGTIFVCVCVFLFFSLLLFRTSEEPFVFRVASEEDADVIFLASPSELALLRFESCRLINLDFFRLSAASNFECSFSFFLSISSCSK